MLLNFKGGDSSPLFHVSVQSYADSHLQFQHDAVVKCYCFYKNSLSQCIYYLGVFPAISVLKIIILFLSPCRKTRKIWLLSIFAFKY